MIDVHAKLLAFLKEQAELSASVSDRMFAIDLPHKCPLPAIAFKKDGGADREPFLEVSFEFIVYANDDLEADQIDGFLHDAMRTLPSGNTLSAHGINWMNNDLMGQPVEFPEWDKYKLRQSFYTVGFVNE